MEINFDYGHDQRGHASLSYDPETNRITTSGFALSSMSKKRPRVIGTTLVCIEQAEQELGLVFPPSFRLWLLESNGLSVESVFIFPVFDARDLRKTSDSIVREYNQNWDAWLKTLTGEPKEFSHLLPFSTFGTGDYYCFDYRRKRANGETPVVLWSHETGECEDRADAFPEFIKKLTQGEFAND